MISSNRGIFLIYILLLAILAGLASSCSKKREQESNRAVYISEKNHTYGLYRNGKPFKVKGASGNAHFRKLADCGGNTIRIWDTTHLGTILDSALHNDLAVIVGLPVANNDDRSFYSKPKLVEKQQAAFTQIVKKYRTHPAILMWCVGNELQFPFSPGYSSFYRAFNALTDMIHEVDPDHPVTTTILNFNTKHILNLSYRCNVDLLSFNIFGRLPELRAQLQSLSWIWNGPFMILEWGINGPWEGTKQTEWAAYIEDASWKKAEIYQNQYLKNMPTENPRFLGACAFFWGNKQETTQTWFSLFDENGAPSETVGTLTRIWGKKKQEADYPAVKYMLLDKRGAQDNIILDPDQVFNAELVFFEKDTQISSVTWELYREDWYKKNNQNNDKKLRPLEELILKSTPSSASVKAPSEEGPYRLFAKISNNNGTFASCNTPFYVVTTK